MVRAAAPVVLALGMVLVSSTPSSVVAAQAHDGWDAVLVGRRASRIAVWGERFDGTQLSSEVAISRDDGRGWRRRRLDGEISGVQFNGHGRLYVNVRRAGRSVLHVAHRDGSWSTQDVPWLLDGLTVRGRRVAAFYIGPSEVRDGVALSSDGGQTWRHFPMVSLPHSGAEGVDVDSNDYIPLYSWLDIEADGSVDFINTSVEDCYRFVVTFQERLVWSPTNVVRMRPLRAVDRWDGSHRQAQVPQPVPRELRAYTVDGRGRTLAVVEDGAVVRYSDGAWHPLMVNP